VIRPDVVLVGCTKAKRSERSAARDMYDPSDLFRRRREYAESSGLPWAILSARLGVVEPDRQIDPYDFTIRQRMAADWDPRGWAIGAVQACFRLAGRRAGRDEATGHRRFVEPLTIEIHAGIDYVRTFEVGVELFATSITVLHPVEGLGIGQQKAWYFGHQLGLEGIR